MGGVVEQVALAVRSAGMAVLGLVALLLLPVLVLGFPASVLTIGVPVLFGALTVLRRFAEWHRRLAARDLDVAIPSPYRPPPSGLVSRTRVMVTDPATWRDLLWLLVNATAGTVLGALPLVLLLGGAATALIGLARLDHGVAPLVTGTLSALLGYWLTPRLRRLRARLHRRLLAPTERAELALRVRELAESRRETVDAQAAELRRIERDLHDGAQARLVALGMSLGMAEEVFRSDPDTALALVVEARQATSAALAELRALVRGIHPPVLADRGLVGAVQALALASPLSVAVTAELSGRPEPPVESALYFAVAETLTNAAKHASAVRAWVELRHDDGRLRVAVRDDGRGGAVERAGGGLAGVRRRLAAFDGSLTVASPPGGPTLVTLELPCELSSVKTSSSSGTD